MSLGSSGMVCGCAHPSGVALRLSQGSVLGSGVRSLRLFNSSSQAARLGF